MKTDKILIVADESPASAGAIRYGFNLARELGAKVALLCVTDPAQAEGNVDAGIFPDEAGKKLKSEIEAFLKKTKKKYGHNVDTLLLNPAGDINKIAVKTAKEWGAKLVVTGTHGRTGLSRLLNGSVEESIIHNSPVPVCVVRAKM